MDEKSRVAGQSENAASSGSSKRENPGVDINEAIKMNSSKPPIVLFVILLVLGVGTGFLTSKVIGSGTVATVGSDGKVQTQKIEKGEVFGSGDEEAFKDNAEGVLREGGIEGEGAYHLERPGGKSQNVYLTSSSVDLAAFIGKKVKVWGETNAAQSAGWLMDVGRLQLL